MKPHCLTLLAILAIGTPANAEKSAAQFGEMTTLDSFGGPSSGNYKPTAAEAERVAWFREARFGMFMHWGLYSKMAGLLEGQESHRRRMGVETAETPDRGIPRNSPRSSIR